MIQSAIVLGAGSWGTALAATLVERGMRVQFWGRDAALTASMAATRRNERYLPSLTLPQTLSITSDLSALDPADMLLFAVPSKGMAEVARDAAAAGLGNHARVLLSCTKGIEVGTGRRMSELLGECFPAAGIGVLSGPNHAEEVAQHLATAAVVASADRDVALALQRCFTLPWFRCYTTDDIIGVEWAGAMKNPYAIAAGIAQGLKLGDNANAALVTRALAEMLRLGTAEGGRAETFYGLSGVGDLIATCFSEHSRNHRLGLALANGQSLDEITASTRMVAEGVPNTLSLHQCAQAKGIRTPILDAVHAILYEAKPPRLALRELLARDPRSEVE
jgi:glycerol-3-phosphate dehydrogenase (NAD(P)+)